MEAPLVWEPFLRVEPEARRRDDISCIFDFAVVKGVAVFLTSAVLGFQFWGKLRKYEGSDSFDKIFILAFSIPWAIHRADSVCLTNDWAIDTMDHLPKWIVISRQQSRSTVRHLGVLQFDHGNRI